MIIPYRMSDLYAILGLNRNASQEDIRDAFKKLAVKHHPDKGGNAETYKKIQNAYEVLRDENRRRMYDTTGSESENTVQQGGMAAGGIPFHFMGGMGGMGPFGFPGVSVDMSDIFGNLFGGEGNNNGRRGRKGGKGPNKYHDVGLRLQDFYKGHEIKLKFNQARRCIPCSGTGAESTEICEPCGGKGVRLITQQIGPMMMQTRAGCDVCNGEGKRILRQCRKCNGKRFMESEKMLEIHIVPGMKDGEVLSYEGECSDSADYDSPGDVVLTLRRVDKKEEELDVYEWKYEDLLIRKQITYVESLLGFQMKLDDHPNGLSPVFTWNGGPLIHGAVLQMPGFGMPKKAGGYGNLQIQVMIVPPEAKKWSPEDAAKLQSVLGGVSFSFPEGSNSLGISSLDSKLVVNTK